ncbi:uncharacterized protein LOC141815955 [Curcuma longa]|uniref:uncharacterized protein LOC141815955 n=1 Tax=Curcuma longa TaxID=136217 RepID=UPI003D9F2221
MGAKEYGEERDDCSSDLEKDFKHSNDGESDYEPARDSLSSQGETATNTDNKVKRASRVPKKLSKREPSENGTRTSRGSANRQQHGRLLFKASSTSQKKCQKPVRASDSTKTPSNKRKESASDPSIVSSEETEDKTIEDVKEIHVMDEAPVCNQSNGTDNETVATEENVINDDKACVSQKIEELEFRIEKLEEELREVAALEISLYSVVPEHGSSAHKVHTPARRLSRLYIHACKYWTQDKKATIAKNTVSGLLLIAKSSGSDVSRLAFWLSNTVVLREIISQTFGNLSNFNATMKMVASNAGARKTDEQHTTLKWKINSGNKNGKNLGLLSVIYDWQDTSTFTQALEKIESWIFSRIVESVWWQTLTPHMQTPMEDLYTPRISEKLLEPSLGDQPQGSFSINLWKSAFHNAFSRICPVRAGGHECGCLPVLARKVMEQCVSRLDVAMFNAILRESAYEIPTNPISDPIIDPKVLPIPAGHLSFGSGAQLKNSVRDHQYARIKFTSFFVTTLADGIVDDKDLDKQGQKGRGNQDMHQAIGGLQVIEYIARYKESGTSMETSGAPKDNP